MKRDYVNWFMGLVLVVQAAAVVFFLAGGCEQPVAAQVVAARENTISGTLKTVNVNLIEGNTVHVTVEFNDGRLLITRFDKPVLFKLNTENKITLDSYWGKIDKVEIPQ